jgi:acetyltransferase-like isoleucine patch superfamily enzyme
MFRKQLRVLFKPNNFFERRLCPLYFTLIAKIKLTFANAIYSSGFWADGKIVVSNNGEHIKIGTNVRFRSRYASNLIGMSFPITLQTIGTGKIEIGNDCGLSSTIISSRESITIGNHVIIGADSRILDHDFHSINYLDRRIGKVDRANSKSSKVIIEDDVFIGAGSIILKGVKVGARSIIGAGSVVSIKEIPPDSVVAGNPAKIIRDNK